MTEQDKVTVEDIIGIVKTEEQTNSVEEVRKLRGRGNETAKLYSSAKVQAGIYCKKIHEMGTELDKGIASFILTLPIAMSYEVWQHLHKVKGS